MGSFPRHLAVGATAVFVLVIGYLLKDVLDAKRNFWIVGALVLLAAAYAFAYALQEFLKSRKAAENGSESAELRKRFKEDWADLSGKVRSQSYNTIPDLIPSPLKEQLLLQMEPIREEKREKEWVQAPNFEDKPDPYGAETLRPAEEALVTLRGRRHGQLSQAPA